jgi:hypothetical protein
MKKKISLKIFSAVLAAVVCAVACAFLVSCENKEPTGEITVSVPVYNTSGSAKKAVIILPGIMGSNLVDAETEAPLWSIGSMISNVAMNKDMLDSEGRFDTEKFSEYLYSFLKRGADGKTERVIRAADMNDSDLKYGYMSFYKSLYDLVESKCGENTEYGYDVEIFQYDWTKSCAASAADLTEFISLNKYENVILIGHSMGGLVIDNYLALSENNRSNTDAVITLSTPHLGAVDSVCLDLGGVMPTASNLLSSVTFKSMLGELNGKLPKGCETVMDFAVVISNIFRNAARTLASTYDMFPNTSLFDTETYASSSPYRINGADATRGDMSGYLTDASFVSSNGYVNSVVNNLNSAQDSLYFDGKFVSDLVETYYFAGTGEDTTSSLSLTYDGGEFAFTGYASSAEGDTLVLVDSAIAGNDRDAENVFIFDGTDHLDIATAADGVTGEITAVGSKIAEVLNKILG